MSFSSFAKFKSTKTKQSGKLTAKKQRPSGNRPLVKGKHEKTAKISPKACDFSNYHLYIWQLVLKLIMKNPQPPYFTQYFFIS